MEFGWAVRHEKTVTIICYLFAYSTQTCSYNEEDGTVKMFLRGRPIILNATSDVKEIYDVTKVQPAPNKKLKLDWVYVYKCLPLNVFSQFCFLSLSLTLSLTSWFCAHLVMDIEAKIAVQTSINCLLVKWHILWPPSLCYIMLMSSRNVIISATRMMLRGKWLPLF